MAINHHAIDSIGMASALMTPVISAPGEIDLKNCVSQ